MLNNMGGPTLIILLIIVLLLFGAPKLPQLARSIGESMKILKKEVGGDDKGTGAAGGESGSDSTTNPAQNAGQSTGTEHRSVDTQHTETPRDENGSKPE